MPTHEVGLYVPDTIWLSKVDIEIPVRSDGEYIGRLHISQGSVDWIGARQQHGHRLSWEKFAEVMTASGSRFKAPSPTAKGRRRPTR
jgi:hypothetical protein